MKKILAMLLSVAIIATIAIGGSIAYLQDTDETVNTMVMGNVDIEQIEQERKDGTATDLATAELITFRNAQKLYPATYSLTSSEPTLPNSEACEPEHVQGGFYKDVVGAMDKIVSVKNVGKSDAYIRTWFAFEADDAKTLKYIHRNWNTQPDTTGDYANGKYVEIAGNGYIVFCVTYPEAIKAGKATPYSLMQVCMDKAASNDYVAQFGDTYEILVLSQGVQSMNFTSAAEAFTNAFGNQHPWTGRDTIAVPTIVKTEAELKAAINSIGSLRAGESINITLGANITLSGNWSAPSFNKFEGSTNGNVTIVIDGNGYSINGLTVNSGNESAGLIGKIEGDASFTARNLTLNNVSLTGGNTSSNYSCGGALIGYCGAWNSPVIDNVTVNGANITGYKYIGGLIGYETTDSRGAVKKAVTVSNCSVNGATLNSTYVEENVFKGHVGGLIGYANDISLTGNTVKNTVITGSTDANRAGAMIGTAMAPVVIGTGNKVVNVKINGAAVDSSNKKIVGFDNRANKNVDGVSVDFSNDITLVSNSNELLTAISSSFTENKNVTLTAGTYTLPAVPNDTFTLTGTGAGTIIDLTEATGQKLANTNIIFENLIVKGTNNDYTGIQHAGAIEYNNVVFNGSTTLYGDSVTFNNCTFNLTSRYIWTYGASTVTFENCTFNTDGKAILVYAEGSVSDQTVSVKNCTFNATKSAQASNASGNCAAIEIDSSLITGAYTLNLEGNSVSSYFSGLYRIKVGADRNNVIVNNI